MRGKGDKKGGKGGEIHIHKEEIVAGEAHGGAWKVAYADFVTAMMAFFLLMWLINATTEAQRKGLADYFSPTSVLSRASSGTGQPFGGHTAFDDGALVSDRGAVQVTVGMRPVVTDVDDGVDEIATQPQAYRRELRTNDQDRDADMSLSPAARAAILRQANASAAGLASPATPMTVGAAPTAPRQLKPDPTKPQPAQGGATRPPTREELRAEQERREKAEFQQAAQQIRSAVRDDPTLAELAKQLVIDMTPEGLRIQILDEVRQPMFAFGSALPNERARLLLQKVTPVLMRLPQDISLAGYTDAAPFPGPDRTNWELSAERANATRRLLVDGGLRETRIRTVAGHADRDPLVPTDPLAAANRRIAIVVLREARIAAAPAGAAAPVPAVLPVP